MKVKMILAALTEAKSPFWDLVVRLKSVSTCTHLMETVLKGLMRSDECNGAASEGETLWQMNRS